MYTRIYQIDTVSDLREYINVTLCEYYELQNGAFQMTEQILVRAGKPCGIFFCLNGPRRFGLPRFGKPIAIRSYFTVLKVNGS